jgi:hypothetical protein
MSLFASLGFVHTAEYAMKILRDLDILSLIAWAVENLQFSSIVLVTGVLAFRSWLRHR